MGWQWHQLDDNANHLHLTPDKMTMPDALPDAQPTVSKH